MNAVLWRGLAALVYTALGALTLAVPAGAGLVVGRLLGDNAWGGLLATMAGAAVAAFWCRLVFTLLWWVKTGAWNWRRTGLRRSTRLGRQRRANGG